MIPINDLGRLSASEHQELTVAIDRVISSGWIILGPEVEAFEAEFAQYLGVQHVVGVGNGTDALELAMRAVGVEPGDEIVLAANAGGYSTTAALSIGAKPRWADVEPNTGLLDPREVARNITSATRAVVVTHLYGQAAQIADYRAVIPQGVKIIEDCAQSHGARVADGMSGSLGDLAAFSFYPTKNLNALGDGGAVATSDTEVAGRIRQLRMYGWNRKYNVEILHGRNSRLDEIQAAVLRVRLRTLDARNARRRAIAATYRAVSQLPIIGSDDERYVGHLCVMLTRDRDLTRERLRKSGISTDAHYPTPDYRQPGWAQHDFALANTDHLCRTVLTVPCFPELSDAEVTQVGAALEALT